MGTVGEVIREVIVESYQFSRSELGLRRRGSRAPGNIGGRTPVDVQVFD